MPSNVVRVSVQADSRGFEQGFDRAQAKAVGFGAAIGTLAGNIAFSLGQKALSAVTDFVGDSVRAFSDLEQAVGGTEAVFGESSAAIDSFAKGSAQAIGLSEAEFRTATTAIGGQLKRMTGDVDFAADRSIFLTEVAADLAATYGGTTAEAVQALGSAFRGEADPAERFNLDLKIGKVNAKALEMGLADTTSEIDDQARAQAILALITEQSADAQGQFAREADTVAGREQRLNAELENQKVLLGQAILPLQQTWVGIQQRAIPIIADLATEIGLMTGALSDADALLLQFEQGEGHAVETAEDLAKALTVQREEGFNPLGDSIADAKQHSDNWTEAAKEAIETTGLSTEELAKLRDEFKLLESQGVITEDQLDEVTDAINEQIVAESNATRDAGRHRGAIEDLTGAQGGLEDAVDDANVEIRDQNELLKDALDRINDLISPSFSYIENQRKLGEAQKAYNEAVKEFGENSPEAIAAAEGIAEANMGIQEAVVAIGEEGVPAAMEALASMGVPESVIQKFGEDKRRIEEIFRNFVLRIGVSAPSLFPTSPSGGGVGWRTDTNVYYPHGGIARRRPGGQQANIASTSDESVIPLNRQGAAFMAETMAQAFKMMGGNGNGGINITVYADRGTNGHRVGEQIVEEIVRARRRGVQV